MPRAGPSGRTGGTGHAVPGPACGPAAAYGLTTVPPNVTRRLPSALKDQPRVPV